MNKKQAIRINENQLKQIVTESLKKVLNEGLSDDNRYRASLFYYDNAAGYENLHQDISNATEEAYIEYASDERLGRWVPDASQRETLTSIMERAIGYAFRYFFTKTSSGAHILELLRRN